MTRYFLGAHSTSKDPFLQVIRASHSPRWRPKPPLQRTIMHPPQPHSPPVVSAGKRFCQPFEGAHERDASHVILPEAQDLENSGLLCRSERGLEGEGEASTDDM